MSDESDFSTPFSREMLARRNGLNLSQRKAAAVTGVGYARYCQVEQGYILVSGVKKATEPSVDFIVKVARGFDWDVADALTLAGHDPKEVTLPDPVDPSLPRALEDAWPALTRAEQDAITELVKVIAASKGSVPHAAEKEERPVPPVQFSAEETPKSTGRRTKRQTKL